ncbi:MAG: translation initiation factor IF-2 [SAR202 cluster bacterium Io17-Chloro-G3]|nr:MAG: translation initiation factor IF-2 [SAR202 cluster bacterium Io17-Chloro-G3]
MEKTGKEDENGNMTQRPVSSYKTLEVPAAISVGSLAQRVGSNPVMVIKQLMRAGIMANINDAIDFDTAAAVVPAFGFRAVPLDERSGNTSYVSADQGDESLLRPRPPVVAILGHVDHGKTTLLDAIRAARVAEKEVGGITQHIGAYQVIYKDAPLTFLDTPGHEAFTAMRARGAMATDIAVLVVAADDGIMPQTVEAIAHIKAAEIPIVVVINKTDLPDADVDRVKRQLSEHDLLIEEWGGDVMALSVSAKAGEGIDELLESLLVVAEVTELRANPDCPASGIVIEAKLDKNKGPLATLLVKTGTLKMGDYVVVGTSRGRAKALINDHGNRVKEVSPSSPVELLGLSELPRAGDTFQVVEDEKTGRLLVESRNLSDAAVRDKVTLEEMFAQIRMGEAKELFLVIKADVQGSVEAVRDALIALTSDAAQVRIVHAASGTITESDIFLAAASKAIILGFNTRLETGAKQTADQSGVEVRVYNIIYRLLEDVRNTLEGLIAPTIVEVIEGHAIVREVFARGKRNKAAGVYVDDGRVIRNGIARVLRNKENVFEGPINSLRHYKDNVREAGVGTECGISLEGFNDFQQDDVIEVYRLDKQAR